MEGYLNKISKGYFRTQIYNYNFFNKITDKLDFLKTLFIPSFSLTVDTRIQKSMDALSHFLSRHRFLDPGGGATDREKSNAGEKEIIIFFTLLVLSSLSFSSIIIPTGEEINVYFTVVRSLDFVSDRFGIHNVRYSTIPSRFRLKSSSHTSLFTDSLSFSPHSLASPLYKSPRTLFFFSSSSTGELVDHSVYLLSMAAEQKEVHSMINR